MSFKIERINFNWKFLNLFILGVFITCNWKPLPLPTIFYLTHSPPSLKRVYGYRDYWWLNQNQYIFILDTLISSNYSEIWIWILYFRIINKVIIYIYLKELNKIVFNLFIKCITFFSIFFWTCTRAKKQRKRWLWTTGLSFLGTNKGRCWIRSQGSQISRRNSKVVLNLLFFFLSP